jgi:preprotein translocase subunit SecF
MFFRRLNWNVVGWLRTVSIISYAIIALGLASMAYHWITTGTPLRLGLSFTGGTDVTAKFTKSVDRTSPTRRSTRSAKRANRSASATRSRRNAISGT